MGYCTLTYVCFLPCYCSNISSLRAALAALDLQGLATQSNMAALTAAERSLLEAIQHAHAHAADHVRVESAPGNKNTNERLGSAAWLQDSGARQLSAPGLFAHMETGPNGSHPGVADGYDLLLPPPAAYGKA